MSTRGCRFCSQASAPPGQCTYATVLCSPQPWSGGNLLDCVQALEKRGILPCATLWCMECKRVSVVAPELHGLGSTLPVYYSQLLAWAWMAYPEQQEAGGAPEPVRQPVPLARVKTALPAASRGEAVLHAYTYRFSHPSQRCLQTRV